MPTDTNKDDSMCGKEENGKRVNKSTFGIKAPANGPKVFHILVKKYFLLEINPINCNLSVV